MGKILIAIYSIGTIAGIVAMIGFYENSYMLIGSSILATLNLFFAVSEDSVQ